MIPANEYGQKVAEEYGIGRTLLVAYSAGQRRLIGVSEKRTPAPASESAGSAESQEPGENATGQRSAEAATVRTYG